MQRVKPILELEALGTHWWITLYEELPLLKKEQLIDALVCTIKEFDRTYTRFRPESLIGRLNQGEVLTEIPNELFELLSWGEYLREISEGYFTLGVGQVLEGLGYDATYSFVASASASQLAVKYSISPFLSLTSNRIQVRPGYHLDLGGIGKGWLIDKLVQLLQEEVRYFAVNGGGDIYASSDQGKPLSFVLENPLDNSQEIGSISIMNQALAASGAQKRQWKDRTSGITRHHLINPFTGQSSEGLAGVFTTATTARLADAASTILYIIPETLISSVVQKLQVEFLMVDKEGRALRSAHYAGHLNT